MAYLQNRFNAVDFFKRFDPTYAEPSFKAALILGALLVGLVVLRLKSIEVLTVGKKNNNPVKILRLHFAVFS